MLFPAIHLYWTKYQQNTIREINASCPKVAISGDGRHDSMGHSAKYGAYSLFCNTKPSVIHFELVQVRFYTLEEMLSCSMKVVE